MTSKTLKLADRRETPWVLFHTVSDRRNRFPTLQRCLGTPKKFKGERRTTASGLRVRSSDCNVLKTGESLLVNYKV